MGKTHNCSKSYDDNSFQGKLIPPGLIPSTKSTTPKSQSVNFSQIDLVKLKGAFTQQNKII